MITYWNGLGWCVTSPGRSGISSGGISSSPYSFSRARSSAVPTSMLCSGSWVGSAVSTSLMCVPPLMRDQVDDGEDHDPHHVDEVPVQTGDLDGLGVPLLQPALGDEAPHRQQPHDADRDVEAVQA